MTRRMIIRQKRKMLRNWLKKWFGSNQGTHWSVAGSVAVIVLGTYLIYSQGGNTTTATAVSANAPVTATAGAAGLKK